MNESTARVKLEKYEQKITQEMTDKIKDVILDGFSRLLHYFDVIDEEDKQKFEEELRTNTYLQDEVISLSKTIAPWVPYIGLTLMGFSVAKYAYSRYVRNKQNDDGKEQGQTRRFTYRWQRNCELLKTFIAKEVFDKIIIICPTFSRNKTYQSQEFIFRDTNILVCKPSIENALIIFDDIVCSEDILKRTSEITKLSFSGHHQNISFILITQDFHTIPKKIRKNCSKLVFFYNANRKQMDTIFDKYLGYKSKEERHRIVNFLQN